MSPTILQPFSIHGRASFGFHFPRALGFAFVVQLFALRDRQFQLDAPVFQVHFGGNQSQSFFAYLAQQFVDLSAMQQQLAPPCRFVILTIAVRILANVRVQQPSLVFKDLGETVLQLNPSILRRFDLGSSERETGFVPLQQVIVVSGMTVIAQDFDFRLHSGLILHSTIGKHAASIVYVVDFG